MKRASHVTTAVMKIGDHPNIGSSSLIRTFKCQKEAGCGSPIYFDYKKTLTKSRARQAVEDRVAIIELNKQSAPRDILAYFVGPRALLVAQCTRVEAHEVIRSGRIEEVCYTQPPVLTSNNMTLFILPGSKHVTRIARPIHCDEVSKELWEYENGTVWVLREETPVVQMKSINRLNTSITNVDLIAAEVFQPAMENGACTRRTNSTILFAYSNEMTAEDLEGIFNELVSNMRPYGVYTKFANVRFDVQSEEPIQYHSDVTSFVQSVYGRLPDPTLGYKDNRGSDVLSVLQKYLDSNQAPLCGSLVYVLVGRYPDETDASHLINQLRENHVFVYFTAKATPSAGNNPKVLSDVASSTNGFCAFGDGHDFNQVGTDETYVLWWPYQFVAQNYIVSGSGRIEVPVFQTTNPHSSSETILVVITLQDHPPANTVSLNFTISSDAGEYVFIGPRDPQTNWGQDGTECMVECFLNGTTSYKWTIDYSYPNNEPQTLAARIYSQCYHDFLPLPPI